jgi:HK97 family phage major capsid protein
MDQDIKNLISEQAKTFEAFKAENDKGTATSRENAEKLNAKLDEISKRLDDAEKRANRQTIPVAEQGDADRANAMRGWIQYGSKAGVNAAQTEAAARVGINLASKELALNIAPRNAIGDAPQTVTTTGGGYAVKPPTLASAIEQALLLYNPMMSYCTVINTGSGEDMNFATNNDTSAAGELVAINSAVAEAALTFGQLTLKAYKGSSKDVIVPFELIQDSQFNIEGYVGQRLGERLGRLLAAQCCVGAGTTAPTGCTVAGTAGVTTAAATAITADEIIDLVHTVDPAYRDAALRPAFCMNDTTLKLLRKLKGGDGQYLWRPGMDAGVPNTLYGFPVQINQAMPAPTAGLVSVCFGAWSKFLCRLVGDVRVIRDPFTYSTKDQTLFVAFMRFDCNLLDAGTHPIKNLTMHA